MTKLLAPCLLLALCVPTATFAQASKLNRAVRTVENMEPAIPHPEQDQAVARKLAALQDRTGKRPNRALRMREYKWHQKVLIPQSTFMHIDMAILHDVGTAPWLFNLYIDPKEQLPVGHRRNAWLASLGAEAKAHLMTFKKYPPKKVGL